MSFDKLPRNYYTPKGWRLATLEEAKNGRDTIVERGLLNKWERARLLDGWISGPGYDFQMGSDFRGCMAYMLVIKLPEGTEMYQNVNLNKARKEVALLLCTEDWNYQVIYWVLKSSSGSEAMDPSDVSEGQLPLSEMETFQKMKSIITDLACEFGKQGTVDENAAKKKFSGLYSVKEVLGGMIKTVKEQDEKLSILFDNYQWLYMDELVNRLSNISLKETWFGAVASQGGADWEAVAEAFWEFLSENFASFIVAGSALKGITKIVKLNMQHDLNTVTTSRKNFIYATDVLFYTAASLCEIIHAPLLNYTESICPLKILYHASDTAKGVPEHFNQKLQQNALWRCYERTGNYDVLDKVLVLVARGQSFLPRMKKWDILIIERLLDSGVNPEATLLKHKKKTALHYAARLKDEREGFEAAELLLRKCNAFRRDVFSNSADTKGRTPLHRAAELGHASLCKLLFEYGAKLDAKDEDGRTALHYAVADGKSELVDLFMENSLIADCVALQDREGKSPLQLAKNNVELVAKLLSKCREPETYFSEVDKAQLLRLSLVKGYVYIVKMLLEKGVALPGGEVDDDGKTVLHLATLCEDETNGRGMVQMILDRHKEKEDWVVKCDKRGRTVLHEAAFKGHISLCQDYLRMNPELINGKDKDGRIPLYDAVQGNHENMQMWKTLLAAYSKKGGSLDDVIDRSGETPFHIAASKGKRNILIEILDSSESPRKQMKRTNFLGQTALHKAAKLGDKVTINILLECGARPFQERDCDGRTALHYAVQAKTGVEGKELAQLLLAKSGSNEEKLLFLSASAAGLGPADQNLAELEVKEFLLEEKARITRELGKETLLQIAVRMGYVEMTKELLTKGYQITDIQSPEWRKDLKEDEEVKVGQVSEQIKRISEQGNDQPTIADNLGRVDYAQGLAALLLNPYLKPPIAVGISGNWGMGKSSLMMQTEGILLKTVAELVLPPDLELSGLSRNGRNIYGKIRRQLESFKSYQVNEGFFVATMKKIGSSVKKRTNEKSQTKNKHNPVLEFLKKYETRYRDIYKSLAVMDKRDMFTTIFHESHSRKDYSLEGSVPAIITVQYNAWKYRNETEALAGMAVEITREMEGSMTEAQWLSTCWRNTWRKQKYNIWIEIIFPCLLAIFLACSFTWIVWLIFDLYKLKEWAKTKYVCLPAAVVIIVWTLAKTVIGVIKPVSTQLMQYVSFPDHTEKLGYQERVISDIKFLKDEIGRAPSRTFAALLVLWSFITALKWGIVSFFSGILSLFSDANNLEEAKAIRKLGSPSNRNLRIIVFVDDLDRCQESVILQVLSAINLVLAVCEISVVLGMDKDLIERAIMKRYSDTKTKSFKASQELADKYLQKIIQIPLDLPEPSKEQTKSFLEEQLGMFYKVTEDDNSETELEKNTRHPIRKRAEINCLLNLKSKKSETARIGESSIADAVGSKYDAGRSAGQSYDVDVRVGSETQTTDAPDSKDETLRNADPSSDIQKRTGPKIKTGHTNSSNSLSYSSIPIRDMLFVRYSAGEWDAICHFQELATDCRKLPREWKRFLNYHRLVWNIFSISNEAKTLAGWQVQLITWIFVCWEWRENMSVLIEKWNDISVLNTSESGGPSLRTIVDHLIEHERRNKHVVGDSQILKEKSEELGEDSNEEISMSKKTEETIQTEISTMNVSDKVEGHDTGSSDESAFLEKLEALAKRQLHTVEKSLRNELAKLEKAIKKLEERVMNQETEKKAKREAETKRKLQNWLRLSSALDRYDVPMEGIQAFQRFRFYCIAGHLPWPLPKDRNDRVQNTSHESGIDPHSN